MKTAPERKDLVLLEEHKQLEHDWNFLAAERRRYVATASVSNVVYVVNRETGCYDDFRREPLGYFPTAAEAKAWCKAAQEAARAGYEKIRQIDEKYRDDPNDEYGQKSDAAKVRVLKKNPYDKELDQYDGNSVDYTVCAIGPMAPCRTEAK